MPNSRCIETGAREGVYLGPQLPVTANRACRAEPGAAPDRYQYILMKLPEMELFRGFFQNLYYYAETMGGQTWGCFRNLYYYAETMGGQSRSFSRLFSKLVLLC